jgi:hypothetical protein
MLVDSNKPCQFVVSAELLWGRPWTCSKRCALAWVPAPDSPPLVPMLVQALVPVQVLVLALLI